MHIFHPVCQSDKSSPVVLRVGDWLCSRGHVWRWATIPVGPCARQGHVQNLVKNSIPADHALSTNPLGHNTKLCPSTRGASGRAMVQSERREWRGRHFGRSTGATGQLITSKHSETPCKFCRSSSAIFFASDLCSSILITSRSSSYLKCVKSVL